MFTAPYFINPLDLNWGPKYGYIWFGSCFLTAIWVFFFFPETKDRTLEEIDELVSLFPCSAKGSRRMIQLMLINSSRHVSPRASFAIINPKPVWEVRATRNPIVKSRLRRRRLSSSIDHDVMFSKVKSKADASFCNV